MYAIYGKLKDQDKYQMLNVNSGEFVTRRICATLLDDYTKADRLCCELEMENPEYFFEVRKS